MQEFLQSRRGRNKSLRVAQQHARQLEFVISGLGGFDMIMDMKRVERYIELVLHLKQPGTVMNYCLSVALLF